MKIMRNEEEMRRKIGELNKETEKLESNGLTNLAYCSRCMTETLEWVLGERTDLVTAEVRTREKGDTP